MLISEYGDCWVSDRDNDHGSRKGSYAKERGLKYVADRVAKDRFRSR